MWIRLFIAAALATTLCIDASRVSAAAQSRWFESEAGLYRLRYESDLVPIEINRIHAWTLRVETAAGQPVSSASIGVEGGMPDHDHGLPTAPRVTRDLGGGAYLLEGVRFHMSGAWVVRFAINAPAGEDVVVVMLEI